uniref:Integrase catalytic domain-containing protein n=1 Tax=Amphimedon queenslandica TaxID=400682 RepID=A0A1X7UMT3_AMPQE
HSQKCPYHPESNGQVEQLNHTFEGFFAKVVNDFYTDWDIHLQVALFAERTAVHETTDYTPVLLDRTPTFPFYIFVLNKRNYPRHVKSIC